jgi:hypothetical protein
MNNPQNWYIVKRPAGHCEIISSDQSVREMTQMFWSVRDRLLPKMKRSPAVLDSSEPESANQSKRGHIFLPPLLQKAPHFGIDSALVPRLVAISCFKTSSALAY